MFDERRDNDDLCVHGEETFFLDLTGADGSSADPIAEAQARLDVARKLAAEGWTIRPTPQGLACEGPPDDERGIEEQLERLGIDADLIEEGLYHDLVRAVGEIVQAADELRQKSWYEWSHSLLGSGTDSKTLAMVLRHRRELEEKFGPDDLTVADDFERGMLNGKLSALRWVLGSDWDDLDI